MQFWVFSQHPSNLQLNMETRASARTWSSLWFSCMRIPSLNFDIPVVVLITASMWSWGRRRNACSTARMPRERLQEFQVNAKFILIPKEPVISQTQRSSFKNIILVRVFLFFKKEDRYAVQFDDPSTLWIVPAFSPKQAFPGAAEQFFAGRRRAFASRPTRTSFAELNQ